MSLLEKHMSKIPEEERRLFQKMGDIAYQIGQILKDKSWTQKQLADLIGREESYVRRVLSGEQNITLETVVRIEAALGEDVLVVPSLFEPTQSEGAKRVH